MRSIRTISCSTGLILLLAAIPLAASTSRTAVSVNGDDANTATNCSLPTPCRTFQAAIGQTTAGGEVVALDSGGFGSFSIGQAVTVIAAPGVYAAAQAPSGGTAVSIGAPAAAVVLRGLVLNGVNHTGGIGVQVSSVGSLHIENCVIEDFATGLALGGGGSYFISDSIIRNNNGSAGLAASSGSLSSLAYVTIDNCRVEENVVGVEAYANVKMTVRNSVVNGNSIGILAGANLSTPAGGPAEIMIDGTQTAYNTYAGVASRCTLCAVVVYNSHITENTNGVKSDFSGLTYSLGNNTVRFNTTADGTFGTTYSLQ